jgi:dihydrofolate reductase
MRKITSGLFISLDGVVEDPQDWHFPYFNDEMGAAVDRQLATADTLLLGRKTYDSFAGAWPEREVAGGEDASMGKALGDARKIVASNQDLQFTWRNSEQLKGNLVEAVTALKNEPGATDIAMSGSVSVVRQLVAAGLLDELHLLVHPIAVRKGMRLFEEGEAPIPLRLISSQAFSTGVVYLIYAPAESTPVGTYDDAKAHLPQAGGKDVRQPRPGTES